jgi:nucleoid-associated protein
MSTIKNMIVHEVSKREIGKGKEHFRDEENPKNEHSLELNGQLTKLFRMTGLSSGGFTKAKGKAPQFVKLLNTFYIDNEFTDFVEFTQAASKHFELKLGKSSSKIEGYLWFNHYENNNKYFLTVVLMKKKFGLSLSDDLSLDQIEQLDLDKLHMAARINLSEWKKGKKKKYLVFKVGNAAKGVTDYFSDFIGCEEYTEAKADTKALIELTKEYCEFHELSIDDAAGINEMVYSYCQKRIDLGEPAKLAGISKQLDSYVEPDETDMFLELAQSEKYMLSNEIVLDKDALRGLKRFSGKSSNVTISFSRSAYGKTVFFEDDELTITEVPLNLKRQLKETGAV